MLAVARAGVAATTAAAVRAAGPAAVACWWLLSVLAAANAQAPGGSTAEPIDDDQLLLRLEAGCAALRDQGRLVRVDDLHREPPPKAVELRLAAPLAKKLEPPDLYDAVRASALVVGVYYRCAECEAWHFDAASGFALTRDGAVATCWHVLEKDPERRETFVVAADLGGHVWPIRAVLAADTLADVCILQTDARELMPLPLRSGARVGERIWCVSNPDHRFGFFSEGSIARRFVDREPPPADAAGVSATPPEPAPGRTAFEVTLDFALGSSGAAIVDACGNAVAVAQATATIVYDPDAEAPDVQMVVKIAAPAAAVAGLVRPPK